MVLKLDEEEPALGAPGDVSPPLGDGGEEEEEEETDSEEEDGARDGAPPLKKGPWTPEEDKRLKDYVEAHGEGNWNQVQRNAGLNRCGKSCRLRWANHLRPDLKKGPFDDQEVEKIIQMHLIWGNKWAKMAACLPGRTDNEIKNFWNTRLKRHQKARLPIYPEYLVSRVSNEDISCHTPEETHSLKRSNEFSQEKVLDLNELMTFTGINYDDLLHDPHVSSLLIPRNPLKRRASTGCIVSNDNGSPEETETTICSRDFNYGMTKSQLLPLGSAIASGYPIFDSNPSTSGTVQRSMKTGLPSFQYSNYDYSNSWLCECPSGPLIEQTDTVFQSSASDFNSFKSESISSQSFIQSSGSDFNSFKSESMSSQNTDWLDAMVHKVDGLDPTKSQGLDAMVSVPPLPYNQVSVSNAYPLRHPSSSVLGDCEFEGSYFDEIQASKSPLSSDAIFPFTKYYPDAIFPSLVDTGMPVDALQGASFLNEGSLLPKDNSITQTLSSIFDVDSAEEAKLSNEGHMLDSPALKSSSAKLLGHGKQEAALPRDCPDSYRLFEH